VQLGYSHPEAQAAALEVLIARGLTNPRKTRIAEFKRSGSREALSAELERLCERCSQRPPPSGRRRVPVGEPSECERCGGSPNKVAVEEAARLFRMRGLRRLLIVGGAPKVHQEFRDLWPDDLELRIVPGDERHNATDARAQLRWADLVIVAGGSILPHKISLLYTATTGAVAAKVIQVNRRGVEALASRLSQHLLNATRA
jgi:hypothetical protein